MAWMGEVLALISEMERLKLEWDLYFEVNPPEPHMKQYGLDVRGFKYRNTDGTVITADSLEEVCRAGLKLIKEHGEIKHTSVGKGTLATA